MRKEKGKEKNNEARPVFLFTEHQADILVHIIVCVLAIVFFFVLE